MISDLNHLTFSVRNLETSFAFYTDVLGLRPIAKWYKGAYLEAGTVWVCLTLDAETRTESLPEYSHTAFAVSSKEFQPLVEQISKAGTICWQQNNSPGDSFYFLDPDGHKLEIHVGTLRGRMEALVASPPRDLILYEEPVK